LEGILEELNKVNRLADFNYLKTKILIPALSFARKRELITALEEKILHIAATGGVVKAADLSNAMPDIGVIAALSDEGFVPSILNTGK
jgi:hypothetical protein